jgi:hypothetical protein
LYKEDFNKFIKGLNEAVDFVKTDLMPDFDFDAFNHDTPYEDEQGGSEYRPAPETNAGAEPEPPAAPPTEASKDPEPPAAGFNSIEEVDKW